jgi:ubiquinone/menaquinone biosynthesis C-methylase UbiE
MRCVESRAQLAGGPDEMTVGQRPTEDSRTVQPAGWIKETAFGTWFLGTRIWATHVLRVALDDLERLLNPRRDRYPVILDVGCGRGIALPLLDARFHPDLIVGLDVDPAALKRAAPAVRGCRCRVELIEGHAACIDLPDGSLDMVFCHQTFHHLCDQASALREFYRLLRPGGALLFAESCRPLIDSLPIRILFRHPKQSQKSAQEYLAMLREAGFEIKPGGYSAPYLWWSRPDLGALEWLGRPVPTRREETLINAAATRRRSNES